MTQDGTQVIVTARAKAFTGERIATHRFLVAEGDAVRVYDEVAGYFTLCHALKRRAQDRIYRLAFPDAADTITREG